MSEIEYRNKTINLRAAAEGQTAALTGYASTFDSPYEVEGMIETIGRDAFKETLVKNSDVFAFLNHDTGRVIARTKTGSMQLETDETGLKAVINPVDTQDGRDALELVRSGTLDSMSFGFVVDDDTLELRDGKIYRTINKVTLHEVSVVAFPANENAKISLRCKERCAELTKPAQPPAQLEKCYNKIYLPPNPLHTFKGSI